MKIIALSDTHGMYEGLEVPAGDVLVFAGDATRHGSLDELIHFNGWLEGLSHKHKIVVAGNHDWSWEKDPINSSLYLTNAVYLQDGELEIDGVNFYGSPWTPQYYDWAFMLPRNGAELGQKWLEIPYDTDVLITHGPPHSILDQREDDMFGRGENVGCQLLFEHIGQLKDLKAHIFGHIHEAYGKQVRSYNVSICNRAYEPVNRVTVIEI